MKQLTSILILFISTIAFAHGEDKPGPNGGFIQMPGSFHTEVVPLKDGSYKIFLLNLQNQEPTVLNSSVNAEIVNGAKKQKLNCMAMGEHFHCKPKAKVKSGTLVVMANRSGAVGIEAKYKLPLKLVKNETSSPEGHESHH